MRCEACDAQLKPGEGRWNKEKGEHESLCRKCLIIVGLIGVPKLEEPEKDYLSLVTPTLVPKRLRE